MRSVAAPFIRDNYDVSQIPYGLPPEAEMAAEIAWQDAEDRERSAERRALFEALRDRLDRNPTSREMSDERDRLSDLECRRQQAELHRHQRATAARQAPGHVAAPQVARQPRERAGRPAARPLAAVPKASGSDGDGPPAVSLTDLSGPQLCGFETARQWKEALHQLGVPHTKIGRRTLCLVADWTAAIETRCKPAAAPAVPAWAGELLATARRGGRR